MISNLITTKFMMPPPPSLVVERTQLFRQLDVGLPAKLILLSAAAGSGKSTLLSSWLRQLGRPSAWLSLDTADNDLERFLLYLIGAVQQVDPAIGSGLQEELQNQSSIQAEPIVARLINDLNAANQHLMWVLDDYHAISNPKIHETLDFLLDHLPSGICVVMATRSDPPLALSRLRVRKQLVEIRVDDLRFSQAETDLFLNERLGLALSPQAIQSLETRTEGWIAGLQLAALSLEGRSDKEQFVKAFAGSHHYLTDYLIDEVLGRLTPETCQFLERTSILERFTAPLCGAVSGLPDSNNRIKQLLSGNLFVIPLDDERRWFRYHQLFAEFLRQRLQEAEAEQVPELHRRASQWFESEGWNDEAIHHALVAKDFVRAGQLVESMAFSLGVSWNNVQLIRYVSRFPLELLSTLPRLCIYYGWALVNTGQVALLQQALPIIRRSAEHTSQRHATEAGILTLEAYHHIWQMDFESTMQLSHKALELLNQAKAEGSNEEHWLRIAANNLIPYSYLHSDLPQADAVYPSARKLSHDLGNFVGAANGFARHGRVKHQLGDLYAAQRLFEEGLVQLENWKAAQGGRPINVGELHLNFARLLYEWNRLEEAKDHLEQASELNQRSQFPPILALEHETAAQIYLASGNPQAALAELHKLEQILALVHPTNLFYQHIFGVQVMNLRLRLAATVGLEHLSEAVGAWVRANGLKPGDVFGYAREGAYAVLARWLLQGKPTEALPLLERLILAAQTEGRLENQIRYQILKVLAHAASGQQTQALALLVQTLEQAEPQGFIRIFVDEGPALLALLQILAKQPSPYLQKILRAFPQTQMPDVPPLAPEPELLEPLNERELSVLRLLAAGNSNKEIGRALELSPNTVRWYVSNLLSKLGVSSRLEAANRARELNLL